MINKKIYWLVLLIAIIMVGLLLAGTGRAEVKPWKFSWYINYDWAVMPEWGSTPDTKYIQDKFGVNVDWVPCAGNPQEKLSTMIAADELPDVMVLDRGPDVERLFIAGKLASLDAYVTKYPNLQKECGIKTLGMLKSGDGKLYQFPNWYIAEGRANGNSGWVVNSKIYKELGSPKLETTADLEKYLLKVKAKYPDVVPLEVAEDFHGFMMVYSAFGEKRNGFFLGLGSNIGAYPVGKELKSIFTDPAFKEAVLFTNKLFRQKLISQDGFTQTQDQVKEKLNTGKVAVYIAGDVVNPGREGNDTWKRTDPKGGYHIIWPIRKSGLDKNKIFPSSCTTLGWNVNVISKSAKEPEKIFALLDWMTGPEGQNTVNFGPQGLFWDKTDKDNIPVPNEKYLTTPPEERDKLNIGAWNWVGNTVWVDTAKAKREMMLPESKRDWTSMAQFNVTWKTSMNLTEFVNTDPMPNSDEGIIMQRFRDIWTESFAKMVFAKSSDEVLSILKKADTDATKAGYDKVLKYRTAKWQENRKLMGLD